MNESQDGASRYIRATVTTFIAEAMCVLYPAGFRLETRWRTGDHSGTV